MSIFFGTANFEKQFCYCYRNNVSRVPASGFTVFCFIMRIFKIFVLIVTGMRKAVYIHYENKWKLVWCSINLVKLEENVLE